MDTWDPIQESFESPEFRSYDSKIAKKIQAQNASMYIGTFLLSFKFDI